MTAHCPAASALADYAAGRLSDHESNPIDEHLHACSICQHTVIDLAVGDDTLVMLLRSPAAASISEDPQCHEVLQRIQQIGQEPSFSAHASAAVSAPVEELGTLREYKLLSKLGEGGMGAVYKAEHTKLRRIVALKVLPADRMQNEQAVARFEREMQAVGALDHPNIVRAMDAGEHQGRHYLVMEYVCGCDLSQLVRELGPLPVAEACELVRQAAIGLQHAHEHGLVHRDIKPSNLMLSHHPALSPGGRGAGGEGAATVKILDLGLALLANPTAEGGHELTGTGQLMGTLDYMAPEQGTDSHIVDIRADIYSLGATLYKLLCGEAPFAGPKYNTSVKKMMALCTEQPTPLAQRRPDVPAELAAIVHGCLAKRPAERYATPEELAEALAPFAQGADLNQLAAQASTVAEPKTAIQSQHSTSTPLHSGSNETAPTIEHVGQVDRQSARTPQHPRWLWPAIAAGLAGVTLLGVFVKILTPTGLVEIELPDDVDANSVAISIKRRGQEIEVADAAHGWKLRIADGRYDVELKDGGDRFKLDQKTVTVERNQRSVVQVTIKPTPAIAPVTDPPGPSRPSGSPRAGIDKPFTIVRDGKDVRAFKSLAGALADVQPEDVIEIRSNERFVIRDLEPVKKMLHVRAGAGFRPTLAFKGSGKSLENGLVAEGLDLDTRQCQIYSRAPSEYRRCRIWGGLSEIRGPKVTISDCVVVSVAGSIGLSSPSTELILDNCLIRNVDVFVRADSGNHTLRLRNCTYYAVDDRFPTLARLGEKAKLTVEATGNVLHCRSQAALIEATSLPQMTWQGKDNCFSGTFYGVWERKPDQSVVLKEKGLAAWNKLWQPPEQGSREVDFLAFEWGRIQRLNGPERLKEVRAAITKLTAAAQLPDVGPDWDLVGPGDAYVRALAAEGRGVPESELRPERLEGGPMVLIRDGKAVRGYLTLKEAIEAAETKDVVEIRTDGPLTGARWSGESRLLTIRAAAGYAPVIDGIRSDGTDRLILEGLTSSQIFASGGIAQRQGEKLHFPRQGSILRLMNCSVHGANGLSGWMFPQGEIVPEIVNCDIGGSRLIPAAEGTARFRNSVFGLTIVHSESKKAQPDDVDIDRCAFWGPEFIQIYAEASFIASLPVAFTAKQSIFVSPSYLIVSHEGPSTWQGAANVFVKQGSFRHGRQAPFSLEQFQTAFQTDIDSIELPPWEFDPAQWRILRDKSPGYQPRPDGSDYGADIDRLIQAINDAQVIQ